MSEDCERIEVMAGTVQRRRWSTEQKLRIIEGSFEPGETVHRLPGATGWPRTCCFAGGG